MSVQCGAQWFIFDAGSGIRQLGAHLLEQGVQKASLFFSHFHWDHIQGFPFFQPAYEEGFTLQIYAGSLSGQGSSLQAVLSAQMTNPFFPVPISVLKANVKYNDFRAGDPLRFSTTLEGAAGTQEFGLSMQTTLLNHPQGATAYRLNYEGRSVCYVTDVEHEPGTLDAKVLTLIEGADLVIYDCTYSDEQFDRFKGWGHSTWQQGIRLCQRAGAKQLAIFHHDPDNDDVALDARAQQAKALWAPSFIAREGQCIDLSIEMDSAKGLGHGTGG